MDDCCAVCAEPLEWTAFGECGHTETCSKCVARLRFVLKDRRCAICQQESERVFFTRYAGKFTERLNPDQFAELKGRARHRELFSLPVIDAFFDEEDHFNRIKSLCSYIHPILEGGEEGRDNFSSVPSLRRHIQDKYDRYFCNVCLTGRKVFVCEQLLYTKQALEKHLKSGDEDGPLAEGGFKGHPQCKFCRRRFFGESEQFQHNQQEHETCFLCRRANPDKYVYYKDYPELEEHFFTEHHPCPHPSCLERRFVIFSTDAELKQHCAKEHKGEMMKGMSRAQLRGALALQTNFQFRTKDSNGEDDQGAGPSSGIIIGGGDNVLSRIRARRRPQGYERDLAQAMQNSMTIGSQQMDRTSGTQRGEDDTDFTDDVPNVNFTEEDFPAVSDTNLSNAAPSAGPPRWTTGGPPSLDPTLRAEDFPQLPGGCNRPAKKQNRRKTTTLAERVASGSGEVRVLNKANRRTPPRPPLQQSSGPTPQARTGPYLSPIGSSTAATSSVRCTSRSPSPARPGPTAAQEASNHSARSPSPARSTQAGLVPGCGAAFSPNTATEVVEPQSGSSSACFRPPNGLQAPGASWPTPPSSRQDVGSSSSEGNKKLQDDFPALPFSNSQSSASLSRAPRSEPKANWACQRAFPKQCASTSHAAPGGSSIPRPEDFPSLPASGSSQRSAANRQDTGSGPSQSTPAAAILKVSNGMKAMNKALIQKIKSQIADSAFASFREESSAFMSGQMSAVDFHSRMVQLGIVHVAVELAGLCPDELRRTELLSVHTGFVQTNKLADLRMPLDHLVDYSSWKCHKCSLINTPQADFCENCDCERSQAQASSSASRCYFRKDGEVGKLHSGKNRNRGKGKQSKFERLRLGVGPEGSTDVSVPEVVSGNAHKVNPCNVWTQNHPLKSSSKTAVEGGAGKSCPWRKDP